MARKQLSRPGPRIMIAIIAVIVIAAVVMALRTPPIDVDIATARTAPMIVTIEDEGETRVKEMFVVAAPINGKLLRIDVEAGDPVEAGKTVIARIAPTDPDFQDVRSAAEIRSQIKSLEAALKVSNARISRTEADRRLAAANFERVDALLNRGFSTRAAHDAARAARDETDARLIEARQAAEAARFELRAMRARLQSPASGASSGQTLGIRAPESGSVLRLTHESETPIRAGDPMIEIGNPGEIEIVSDFLSSDAVRIKPGNKVLIERWGGNKPLAGTVQRVEPFGFTKISALGVEEQRVNVIIDLVDPREAFARLGHGYRVIVRVVEWSGDDILQIPVSALFRDQGDWAVFTVSGGDAELTRVKIGRMNSDMVQITDGLEADQQIILHPSEKITDGRRVRPRSESR